MSDQVVFSQPELLRRVQRGWDDFNTYLNTLTEKQKTVPTDAAGWTVKDHIMHLAVWEDGMIGLLRKRPQYERMGLDEATWKTEGYDVKNAVIQQRHQNLSLDEVMKKFRDVHQEMVKQIESMSTADLEEARRNFVPASTDERPIWMWVTGNTYEHYAEHLPWIAAIAEKAA